MPTFSYCTGQLHVAVCVCVMEKLKKNTFMCCEMITACWDGKPRKREVQDRQCKQGHLCLLLSNMQEGFLKAHRENSPICCHTQTCTHTHVERTPGGRKGGAEDREVDRRMYLQPSPEHEINCWANVAATYGSPLCSTVLPPERTYLIFHNLLQHGISVTALLCMAAAQLWVCVCVCGGGVHTADPSAHKPWFASLSSQHLCDFEYRAKQVCLDFQQVLHDSPHRSNWRCVFQLCVGVIKKSDFKHSTISVWLSGPAKLLIN